MERVQLSKIRLDGGTQIRSQIHLDSVAEYAENLSSLPPSDVFHDGTDYWLADGFHRYHAHAKAGEKSMPCIVHKGTPRDAILFAVGANAKHGIRRSNIEKHKAVNTLLRDKEWSKLSDREIAKRCDVSRSLVSELRGNTDEEKPPSTGNVASSKPKNRITEPKTKDGNGTVETFYDDDSAQKSKPAPVETKDEAGQEIRDEKVLAVYRRRSEITDLMTAITTLKATVNKGINSKDPLFIFINASQFEAECDNIRRALRFARPYALCPYCGGRGCKACKSGGWVNEQMYKNYTPEDLKV